MNTAIIYMTKTKHSKKIADAIGNQLHISPLCVTDNPQLKNIGLLFIVGGIYGNESLPEMFRFTQNLSKDDIKKVVLITSCCTKNTPQKHLRELLTLNGIDVLQAEFICQGSFLVVGLGHPNKDDLRQAAEFAKDIYEDTLNEATQTD